jgi:hypothetical protein
MQPKFAHPRIFEHYAAGCNLAESYYQSVQAPFQLLIVGDALCQPWAQPIELECTGLPEGPVSGVLELKLQSPQLDTVGTVEVFIDGVRFAVVPRDTAIRIDTRALGDGYHELRIVAIANQLVATQSRRIVPLTVSNRGESLQLEPEADRVSASGMVVLNTEPRDVPIDVFHNHRIVATMPPGTKRAEIPANQLGVGTAQLSAVLKNDGRSVYSPPVTVEIE